MSPVRVPRWRLRHQRHRAIRRFRAGRHREGLRAKAQRQQKKEANFIKLVNKRMARALRDRPMRERAPIEAVRGVMYAYRGHRAEADKIATQLLLAPETRADGWRIQGHVLWTTAGKAWEAHVLFADLCQTGKNIDDCIMAVHTIKDAHRPREALVYLSRHKDQLLMTTTAAAQYWSVMASMNPVAPNTKVTYGSGERLRPCAWVSVTCMFIAFSKFYQGTIPVVILWLGRSALAQIWCGRRDSNPHDFRRWNLNPVRLPIPPRPPEKVLRAQLSAERRGLYHGICAKH